MAKNKSIRKERYDQLIKANYTPKEAAKLKDVGNAKFAEAIKGSKGLTYKVKSKIIYDVAKQAGFNSKEATKISRSSKEKLKMSMQSGVIFKDNSKSKFNYQAHYTYKIEYNIVKKRNGKITDTTYEMITTQSNKPQSREQIIEFAKNKLLEQDERGQAKYISTISKMLGWSIDMKSVKIVEAFYKKKLKG